MAEPLTVYFGSCAIDRPATGSLTACVACAALDLAASHATQLRCQYWLAYSPAHGEPSLQMFGNDP